MSFDSKQDKHVVRIELTPDQQAKVLDETGKVADAIELSASELEERIAPMVPIDLES